MTVNDYLKRKDSRFVILIILWFILGGNFFILQVASIKHAFFLMPFSLERKYEFIDSSFYGFAKYCLKEIPPDARVIFINKSTSYRKRSVGWLKAAYFRDRMIYYLCPRRFITEDSGYPIREVYKVVFEIKPAHFSFQLYYPGEEPDGSP
jgi:hypothetical protein